MAAITTATDGTPIYYNNGQAINAKTGAAYVPSTSSSTTVNGGGGAQPGADASKAGTDGYDVYGNKVTEPAVISSGNISDTVIPDMKTTANTLAQKGTYIDTTGVTRYADGSAVPAPTDAEFDPNTSTWTSGNTTYAAGPQYVNNDSNDPDTKNINDLFDAMKSSLDSSTLAQVNGIQQQYDLLKQQQAGANARADSARTTLNLKSGTTQFAPLDAAGTALAQTTYGLQQIAKLDADENNAIAQVKTAQANGNFQLMSKALDTAQQIRSDKQAAAQKLADTLSAANDAALKQQQQEAQDNAVGSLVSKGITDPAQVLKSLNDAGYNVTAAQVAASLKNLQTTTTPGQAYKFANNTIGTLLGAGLSLPQIQAVQDFYNGKGDSSALSGLTAAQQAAVHTALVGKVAAKNAAGSKEFTSGTLKYTADDLAEGKDKLEASKGDDGYVDPNVYLNMVDAWTSSGGSVKDFLKSYPVSSWINPANTFVSPALNALVKQDASTIKTTGTSDLANQIDAAFSQTTPSK